MRMSEIEEPAEHMGFILQVFGYEARLEKDDFISIVSD